MRYPIEPVRGLIYSPLSLRKCPKYCNEGGVDNLFSPRKTEAKKYGDTAYKENLFKILHTPPAFYNINRTTWKMDDLQRIMALEGFGLCKDIIRQFINDA